ncbi:MAG: N-acetylmuramoyl-L-alanine amidase [Phycisphaerae bacterium]|nr:N-acetylmuramoyl-L-alanine amidase [Phycisphaerae bacterium]
MGSTKSSKSSKSHRQAAIAAMQHNRRMARTLVCLVASMTLGAALLDWVQPKPAHMGAYASGTELTSMVNSDAPGIWNSIRLDAQPTNRSAQRAHFVVHPNGQVVRTSLWQQQQSAGEKGVVSIAIASDHTNQMTQAQIDTAKALAETIRDRYRIQQVHVDDTLVGPVGPSEPAPAKAGTKAEKTQPKKSSSNRP